MIWLYDYKLVFIGISLGVRNCFIDDSEIVPTYLRPNCIECGEICL